MIIYCLLPVQLVDINKDLTNGSNGAVVSMGLPSLDPFRDVPDATSTMTATHSWMLGSGSMMQQPRCPKEDPFAWQKELVERTWKMGQPQLLRCVSTLVVTAVAALDAKNVLVDRVTHIPNVFGEVSCGISVSWESCTNTLRANSGKCIASSRQLLY